MEPSVREVDWQQTAALRNAVCTYEFAGTGTCTCTTHMCKSVRVCGPSHVHVCIGRAFRPGRLPGLSAALRKREETNDAREGGRRRRADLSGICLSSLVGSPQGALEGRRESQIVPQGPCQHASLRREESACFGFRGV